LLDPPLKQKNLTFRRPSSGLKGVDVYDLGIPTHVQLIEAYCDKMGIPPLDNFDFYLAFGFFRLAASLQSFYEKAVRGASSVSLFVFGDAGVSRCECRAGFIFRSRMSVELRLRRRGVAGVGDVSRAGLVSCLCVFRAR